MKPEIQDLVIVGSGNVAFHLCKLFTEAGVPIHSVVTRDRVKAQVFNKQFGCALTGSLMDLPSGSLVILCIPDDVIGDTIKEIRTDSRIAYTSGSVALETLPARDYLGVFYPLQSFSKESDRQVEPFPIFIESNNETFTNELFQLASKISEKVVYADSEMRSRLHLSAVWVNNFTNHILYHAQEIGEKYKIDFDLLLPLLKETIHKLEHLDAYSAQTGPARRGDLHIVQQQSEKYEGIRKELYNLLSKSIMETYRK